MIDNVQIQLKAGKGGDGHVSFLRLRGKPYGPPVGGDGGKGGDIYLEATQDLNTLLSFRFKKEFAAGSGENGGRNRKKGAQGEDLLLKVPEGTIIKSLNGDKLYDLDAAGKKILVVLGGKGGRGNAHLSASESADARSKKEKLTGKKEGRWEYLKHAEKGQSGEEIELVLELQVLADVGLIGLPNAGKSTLLSKLTAATPKIASYPFTTLEPNLGVLSLDKSKSVVIADIPGLIEGAWTGRGLGDQFLKHITRTKVLVHLLDVASESPLTDYKVVRKELGMYDPALVEKKEIVVLNKADLLSKEALADKLSYLKKSKIKPLVVSGLTGEGLRQLIETIFQQIV